MGFHKPRQTRQKGVQAETGSGYLPWMPLAYPWGIQVEYADLPVHAPDEASDTCTLCHSEWGWGLRRHHCRVCGTGGGKTRVHHNVRDVFQKCGANAGVVTKTETPLILPGTDEKPGDVVFDGIGRGGGIADLVAT